ncbi:MAG TPA: aromatic ring-hydroxylating dioxygenase subunit alpha, partial [Candidatus Obscuribacter sp.]|nr:aromatic ring-hydroxylating dioxygenase subunit alpha [Candidatus Obscuribacter sp.]
LRGAQFMQLPRGWYVLAASHEVKSGKPLSLRVLGRDLVFWRNEGKLVVMADRCPHRSASLSLGRLRQGCIECPFHGFRFSAEGDCKHIPETGKGAENLKVEVLACLERHGFIWHYYGSAAPSGEPPWFEELGAETGLVYSERCHTWPMHITRCVENQLDYAHLPFVHANTIGGNLDVSRSVEFELDAETIKFYPGGKKAPVSGISFIFPAFWRLAIVPGRFMQMIAFVPVDDNETRIYLRGYQKFVTLPVLSDLFGLLVQAQNSVILNQDRAVVLSQKPANVMAAGDENLYQSDRGIAHFRKLWADRLLANCQ